MRFGGLVIATARQQTTETHTSIAGPARASAIMGLSCTAQRLQAIRERMTFLAWNPMGSAATGSG